MTATLSSLSHFFSYPCNLRARWACINGVRLTTVSCKMSRIISGVEIYGAPSEHAYHYTTSGSAFVHILPRHELRFSRLSEMRDPIENKDWVHVLLGSPAWSVEKVRELEAVANAVAYETKILSFTLDGSTEGRRTEYARGYARPRMWEQYGQNHEGVCLVFDHERLRFQVDEQCAAFAQGAEQRRAMSDTVVYNDMPLPGHELARSPTQIALRWRVRVTISAD